MRAWRQVGFLFAGLALFLAVAIHYFPYTPDDVFITLRYAENIAAGQGAVFNPGEAVEGFSNPLLTFGLATLHGAVGSREAMTLLAKMLGLVAGLFTLLAAALLARSDPEAGAWWGATPLLVGLSGYFAFWSPAGLETAPHALLVLLAIGGYIRALETGRRAWRVLVGVLFGLLALSRPEAPIFLVAVLLARGLLLWRDGRKPDAADAGFLALALLPLVGYFLWRHATYGLWWPNTFYAKAGGGLSTWLDGARYLLGAVSPALWGNALLLPLLLVGLVPWRHAAPRQVVLICAVAAQAGFIVIGGGDWMPARRFIVPVVPLIALLTVFGVHRLRGVVSSKWLGGFSGPFKAAALALVLLAAGAHLYSVKDIRHAASGFTGLHREIIFPESYRAVADWLDGRAEPGDWLATGEAGLIPYFTGLPTIDLFGLTDAHLARRPGKRHQKVDPDYVLGCDPRFVVMGGSYRTSNGYRSDFAYGRSLLGDPRFVERYEMALERESFLVWQRRQ
jgi:arabinofuranosyltransferase